MDTFPNVTELSRGISAPHPARVGSMAQQTAATLMEQYFLTTPGRVRTWLVFDVKTRGGLLLVAGPVKPHKRNLKRIGHLLGVAEVASIAAVQDTLLIHGPEGLRFNGSRVTQAGH